MPGYQLDRGGRCRIRTCVAFATDLQSAPIGRSGNLPPSRVQRPGRQSTHGYLAKEGRTEWRTHRSTSSARSTGRRSTTHSTRPLAKELATRFDFRGTDTKIAWKGDEAVELTSSTEERVKAAVDVFKEKLIRRDISLKAFEAGEPQASGKTYKVTGALKQGISSENAKKITKLIRDAGPKNVKTQIQGDEVRVTSKKRDDLQAVIAMLKKADLDVALQFVNYR